MDYYYAEEEIKNLKNTSQLIVFGAGNVAYQAVSCLRREPYCLPIEYCMVSKADENPRQVDGIPVIDYCEAQDRVHKDALILIALMEKYLDSAEKSLHEHGFFHLLPITFESDLWSLLRGNCYRNYRLSHHKSYLTVEEELENSKTELSREATEKIIHIYRVCCHMDRELREDTSRFSWEIPIQAGAALTKERICDICDNEGENISEKNRQYCELTALYWIWKHDRSDYVGLGHYRRHFELDERQLKRLADSDIDIVLTIPIIGAPNVEAVYRMDHIGDDWDIMMEAIEKIAPDYMEAAQEMGKGRFYYGYNMFIMRREILENYCRWLFPILSYCEEHCKAKESVYQNRYIGFLAERLMTIYMLRHEKEYKIVHARKHFIW